MSGRLCEVILIAGPNGAGKTSFARRFLSSDERQYRFFNADEIARGLVSSGLPRAQADFRAGREILLGVKGSISLGDDAVIETTLASAGWAKHIPSWQEHGYSIVLYYLRLSSPEAALARVRRRVANGGHDIPEDVVRRRFHRSRDMLEWVYKPVVDEWFVFDSHDDKPPTLVESGSAKWQPTRD